MKKNQTKATTKHKAKEKKPVQHQNVFPPQPIPKFVLLQGGANAIKPGDQYWNTRNSYLRANRKRSA